MNNEIQIFESKEFSSIRTIEKNKEIYFVVKDICNALDLVDISKTISRLKEDYEQIQVDIDGVLLTHPILDALGRIQETKIINETGLYDLIMQSRKPSALKFKHWITSKILPSIRKTGSYKINKPKQATISSSYKEASTIVQSYMKVGKLLGTAEPMAKAIAVEQTRRVTGVDFKELLPLANIQEVPVGIRDLAKKLNIKENKLKDILSREGLMTRADDENKTILLTEKAKSLKMGTLEPFQSKSSNHVGYQSKWFPSIIKEFIESKYQEAA